MYIYRETQNKIQKFFEQTQPAGLILSGIVGCGKTTLIENQIQLWASHYEVFRFSGDSTQFRQAVRDNSEYLYDYVSSRTGKSALIFVDEVQKCEEVFDAIKIAFDRGKFSFIISGSNPAYLATIARRRLQRRTDFQVLMPISMSELVSHQGYLSPSDTFKFAQILWSETEITKKHIPQITLSDKLISLSREYLTYGGLPLSLLAKGREQKLTQIRMTVERGFELMSVDNNSLADTVRIELANLHSKEFAYKNIFEKTRTRRREEINKVIDQLINHGYLVRKKPLIIEGDRTSYLSIFSYTDPGIVSYLTGLYDWQEIAGFRVEGYVHSRLVHFVSNSPLKASLHYYKPYTIDVNDKIKYQEGEVDFIFQHGHRMIPIEVKASIDIGSINLEPIKSFMIKYPKVPFGIIIYGGVPQFNKSKNLLFWPYWLL